MEGAITLHYVDFLSLWNAMENYGILLVDDEPAYHAIVSALLVPRGGAVDGAGDAASALEAIRSRRYDLILVDINMAEADGYDAVAAIRAAGDWTRAVPILAFTAEQITGGERHYLDAGFDGWLPKPFQAAELIMTLQRWLGVDRVGTIAEQPEAKLAALIGAGPAAVMIERFHAGLAEAVEEIDAGSDARSPAHRIGGLAGTLGFPVLSAAWLSLQHGDASAWPTVRTLTLEAIARHRTDPTPGSGSMGA